MNLESLLQTKKNARKPLVIAGPCSAETEEQTMLTAQQIADSGIVDIFRAGVWKPRTQPNSFEGVGIKGLEWLAQVKEAYRMPVATEVANVRHVEVALHYGVDVLWIGARTTTNPFAMQEIADALRGTDIGVLVKNPVAPDLALWIGAIERLGKVGIKSVAAVHRGFSSYQKTAYRNQPLWQIPIELKRRMPEIALLCDPSHIGGRREYLYEILQKATDLAYDGWMIESHVRPDEAWSDAAQQITPPELVALAQKIVQRAPSSANADFIGKLQDMRMQIDWIDDQLVDLLAQRMKVSDDIGEQKKVNNVAILQSHRRNELLQKALDKGEAAGFAPAFIEELFELIHQESINRQTKIMNE